MYGSSDESNSAKASISTKSWSAESLLIESETGSGLNSTISADTHSDVEEREPPGAHHFVDDNCRSVDDSTLWAETSIPKRASSIKSYQSSTSVRSHIPRRYKRMNLRSHDDLLKEQYAALTQLIDSRKRMSQKQLQEEHISQTLGMIGS